MSTLSGSSQSATTATTSEAGEPEQTLHARLIAKQRPQLKFFGKKTGIAYDVRMRYHSYPIAEPITYVDPHPEDPRRTFRIYRAIAEAGLIDDETLQGSDELGELMLKIPSRFASEDELLLKHSPAMIEFLKQTSTLDLKQLKQHTDTSDSVYLNHDSYTAARLSAGSVINACRIVVEGKAKNSIAVVRPPGHHAGPDAPAGFCLFANVSIASEVIFRDYPEIKKILIYDWDVHHGNGTQQAFLDDDRVLYISTHRYEDGKFYPGTTFGGANVVGTGKGEGFTVNIPWKTAGMGDGDYLAAFNRIIMPIAYEFDPDLVIVSAGFDAATNDPIGGCNVTPMGYQHMLAMLMTLAEGNVVVTLEGGYNLDAISKSALAVTKTLLGDPPGRLTSSLPSVSALQVFDEVQAIQSKYWKCMGPPTILYEPEVVAYQERQKKLADAASAALDEDRSDSDARAESERAESESQEMEVDEKEEVRKGPSKLNSLLDVISSFERDEMTHRLRFAPLPLLRAPQLSALVLSTPDIYDDQTVAFFFRQPSLVWAHKDPITGRISPESSIVANPSADYLEWAVNKGYGCVDVCLPTQEAISPSKLVQALCENSVRYFRARKMVVIGEGQAYAYAVQFAAHRELKEKLAAIVCFVGPEDPLRQFPSSSDDAALKRFNSRSLIFTSELHPSWNQRWVRKKSGRLIKSEGKNLYAVMRQSFSMATEYIDAEMEDEDDGE